MRPTRCRAARAGSATSSSSTARWSGRAAAALGRNAAPAPSPRAAGEGTGTCREQSAWSRSQLRSPLTRHNYVDINVLCQANCPDGASGEREGKPPISYAERTECKNVKGADHADDGTKDHALPVVRYPGRS